MSRLYRIIFLIFLLFTIGSIVLLAPVYTGNRPLTETERAVLEAIYAASVDLQKVRINEGGPLTLVYPGVTLGNTISFPRGTYQESDTQDLALLVHEVCHVWQYQNFGLGYIPRSVWELITQTDTYVIHYDSSKSLRGYDVEEQCEIMAEYFLTADERYEPYVENLEMYNKL